MENLQIQTREIEAVVEICLRFYNQLSLAERLLVEKLSQQMAQIQMQRERGAEIEKAQSQSPEPISPSDPTE